MRVEDAQGNPLTSIAEWATLYDSPKSSHQWKEHRSAYSVAEFVLNRNGMESLRSRVSDAVGEVVEFERAIPEYEIRFGTFGQGRVHDIAIFGRTAAGKSLFVGVEAKVDESFGLSVKDAYLAANAKRAAGKSTNAPERIEELLKLHFANPDASSLEVRYQLLYATAGTLAAGADVSVLYVIVFKTAFYNEATSEDNYRDYVNFMTKVGSEPVRLSDKNIDGRKLSLQGQELICLHEHIELQS